VDLYQSLENTKAYLVVDDGTKVAVKLDLSPEGVSISQTFTEKTFNRKTIGSPASLIDAGVINKANPANFSFTVPIYKKDGGATSYILGALTSPSESTSVKISLHFFIDSKAYVLDRCVITSGVVAINTQSPLSIAISGEAARLFTYETIRNIVNEDGSIDASYSNYVSAMPVFTTAEILPNTSGKEFLQLTEAQIASEAYSTFGGTGRDVLASLSLEVQNSVKWVGYQTLAGAVTAQGATSSQYPSNFVLTNQSLAGSGTFYIKTKNQDVFKGFETNEGLDQKWQVNAPLAVSAFSRSGTTNYGVSMVGNCNTTSRVSFGVMPTVSIDWRLVEAPISEKLTFTLA